MGFRISDSDYADWVRRGLVPNDTDTDAEPENVKLLPSIFVPQSTFVVGVVTKSEQNQRGHWSKHHGRKQSHRAAVADLFSRNLRHLVPYAEAFHGGQALRLTFTRLAPRSIDRSALGAAMKWIEDAVAEFIAGGHDESQRWLPAWEQEKSERYGVRIQLEVV